MVIIHGLFSVRPCPNLCFCTFWTGLICTVRTVRVSFRTRTVGHNLGHKIGFRVKMTKKELWEDVQENDKQFAKDVLLLNEIFGKVELLKYEREDVVMYENDNS